MSKLVTAFTKTDAIYPGYINVTRRDDGIVLTVRGDPLVSENGSFVCGYERDKGDVGRCTPGDANCNNYCNMAPSKGPMADAPKPTTVWTEAETTHIVFDERTWQMIVAKLG